MNERIRELAEQAGLVIEVGEDEDASDVFDEAVEYIYNSYDIDLKKFAELIVRECIERVRNQYIPIRDQTEKGKLNPFHPQLRLRTEREEGIVSCGVNSVIALEELIQEQTDRWYKENIQGVGE